LPFIVALINFNWCQNTVMYRSYAGLRRTYCRGTAEAPGSVWPQ